MTAPEHNSELLLTEAGRIAIERVSIEFIQLIQQTNWKSIQKA